MSRTLIVARTEFLTLVRTKAFIIGILMMPVFVGLSIVFQIFAATHADTGDHALAVVDRTGALYDALAAAADEYNARGVSNDGTRTGPRFLLSKVDPAGGTPAELEATLSDRVRRHDLFAFVDIPAGVLASSAGANADEEQLAYYTETPSYSALPNWIRDTVGAAVTSRRLKAADVDPDLVKMLTRPTRVTTLGLVQRNADGTITEAKKTDALQTFVVPFAMVYLLFLSVMASAPQLLTAVIEEKLSRISEVLIASVTPFQLMVGKLIGVASVCALLAVIYLAGGVYVLLSTGHASAIQPALLGWFAVFLLCAVLMYGSVFIAIGSACSDIKDSQSMMQPIIILLVLPLIAAPVILQAPGSTIAVAISLIPTATRFIMLLRLAMTPPPPLWQAWLSVGLTLGTAFLCVWGAGRIFRIGLLMQGKPPNLPELLRWIRR
jgi:ABC-2 type transport system permease protein